MIKDIDKGLLSLITDYHSQDAEAFNIRKDGESIDRRSSKKITISPKAKKNGIDIRIKKGTKGQVHIPVILTKSGVEESVYNDFYIQAGADVVIVAGCGIHNDGDKTSRHDGIHTFYVGKGAKVKYIEKHLGKGTGAGKVLNPVTRVYLREGASMEMETTQLGGVTYSKRDTMAKLEAGATLVIKEKILTEGEEIAKTKFDVVLRGEGASVEVISRSVAKDESYQAFDSLVVGESECFGHVECDAILIGNAVVDSSPRIKARNVDATLVHEAAIGKIAGEQLTKLMTLGLNESEAEDLIIKGFLS